ncbi:TetR/AcrR family transcriptional regulator [Micromonospora sp. NPDC049679]|uniref:TetR/AcrR family transcriptional regulator n=1 Tax=Micromonospora sp. NPDC049679 TaxID=3155920 RepID=UPI0033EEB9F1
METTAGRRRAPAMSADQRRAMIVQAALPLVAEHGAAVTTLQVARAAGIGEATIFRAFADKDALLDACLVEAMRPDHVLAELASIPLEQPLAARLVEAVEALQAHLHRLGAVVAALHASGRAGRADRPVEQRPPSGGREESMASTRAAIAELFTPEHDRLRQPAERLAELFLGFLFVRGRMPGASPLTIADLVDLFLHGALGDRDGRR